MPAGFDPLHLSTLYLLRSNPVDKTFYVDVLISMPYASDWIGIKINLVCELSMEHGGCC